MKYLLSNIIRDSLKTNRSFIQFNSVTNMSIDIGGMRTAYKDKSEAFLEKDIPVKEPIHQFQLWFEEIRKCTKIVEPNAMCLSTATKDGVPSARYVLLKGFGSEGFKFFTHYTSRKGLELNENPVAALTFYWDVFNRSVRIEGAVRKLDLSEADKYFSSRPRQSQIGALASKQSTPIAGREVLCDAEKEISAKFEDCKIPRPENWGGYILMPKCVEFWQGQTDRLHDRIKFRRPNADDKVDGIVLHQGENGWVYERLAP